MNKNIFLISILGSLLLVAACTPVQQPVEPTDEGSEVEMISIGFMGPMTGDAASYGLSILRGAQLAVKEAGLKNVKLVTQDSRCEAKDAVSAINKLTSVDGVVAIVGEVCSGATLGAAPVAKQNKVVMISPSSTSPAVSDEEWVFRTVPSDALQGEFGAKLIAKKGFSKLAVLHPNEDYGVGFKTVLEEEFPLAGGEVVAAEAFQRGAVDMRTQITKIKNANPDAIYLISNSPDSAVAALKQLKELGVEVALFGSEGLKSQVVIDGSGDAAEGLVITAVSSGNEDFSNKHMVEYGEEPGPFSAQGYDAFKAIALALENGANSGEDIRNELLKVSFEGATGSISFDEKGDVSGNYDVFVVKEGVFLKE